MAEDDMFGDSSLFDEFEKERESVGTFISFNKGLNGEEDKSRVILSFIESDSESSSDDSDYECNNGENETEKEITENDHSSDANPTVVKEEDLCQEKKDTRNAQTTFQLSHERDKYCKYAKIIDSTRFLSTDETSPACQVIFQNNNFARKYRPLIEKFLHKLLLEDLSDNEKLPDLPLKMSHPTCVDINNKLQASQRTPDMWAKHAIIGSAHFHKMYMVDCLGWPLVANNPSLTDGWEVPSFEQVFMEPLPYDDLLCPINQARPKPACFNCGGDHMISDCKEPKDQARIRMNRDLMKSNQPSKPMSQRYHKESGSEKSKFRPGVISADLRDALGLNKNQIPMFVYKMRAMGYPPGWLEEAKFEGSGLSLFDKDGKEVDVNGEMTEEGELYDSIPFQGQIDPEKIVEYPGFTTEMPSGCIEESASYGLPPLQSHQLKSTLVSDMKCVKRKIEEEEEEINKRVKMEEEAKLADMDMSDDESDHDEPSDNFLPPLPVNTPPGKPPLPQNTPPCTPEEQKKPRFPALPGHPPLPLDTPPGNPPIPDDTPPVTPITSRQVSQTASSHSRSDSPSLEDLEQQYKLIQQRLARSDSEADTQTVDSYETEDDINDSGTDAESQSGKSDNYAYARELSRVGSASSINTFGELGQGSQSLPGTPIITPGSAFTQENFSFKPKTGSISKNYGTPILSRSTVSSALPDSSKFGVGIEDHIPYENLPNATGAFLKMTGLISKIREKASSKKKKKL